MSQLRLENCSMPGRDPYWSDNGTGDGQNWLGLLLMFQRVQLVPGDLWEGWLRKNVDLSTESTSFPCKLMVKQAHEEVTKTMKREGLEERASLRGYSRARSQVGRSPSHAPRLDYARELPTSVMPLGNISRGAHKQVPRRRRRQCIC